MAHKIIAADLGSSNIKLARFEASFRKVQLLDARGIVADVDPALSPEARLVAQVELVGRTMTEDKYLAEELAIGLPGDLLTFRIVDLPFSGARQIEQTLGYELESQILTPVEELLVDFVIVGPVRQLGTEPPSPGTPTETRVLAACAPRTLIDALVKKSQELGLPLRTVGASPLAYAAFLASWSAPSVSPLTDDGDGPPPGPMGSGTSLILDIGSETTSICAIRDGKPEMARTIGRGGRQVSDAIALAFALDDGRAEQAKYDSAFLAHRAMGQLTPSQAHMDATVRGAMVPLVRELRQTMAAYHATYGDAIERIFFTGGGARVAGLAEFLTEELGIPSAPLPWPGREGWSSAGSLGERTDVLGIAVGLGLSTVTPGVQVNFRKGEFAYRSDYSFLRDKARYVAVAMAMMLIFAGVNAWASMRGLHKEHDLLAARLKAATTEVFGKARSDAKEISDDMKSGPKGIGQLPIPSMTAFDLLDEISKVVPPADKIKLDLLELEIKPHKTLIKATTETAQQVDDFADALRKIECFEDVQKGKLSTVAAPPPPPDPNAEKDKDKDKDKDKKDAKPAELKQFTVTIKSSCP